MTDEPLPPEAPKLRRRRRKLWSKAQRQRILDTTAGHCYSCGLPLALADDWWVEHIVPFAEGGSEQFENLLPSCKVCNHVRLHHKAERFRRLLVVGDAMLNEIEKGSALGKLVLEFLAKREAQRQRRRKHPDLALRPPVA